MVFAPKERYLISRVAFYLSRAGFCCTLSCIISIASLFFLSINRLVLMLLLSVIQLTITYFLPSTLAVAVFCACVGYILSLDLATVCSQIYNGCRRKMQTGSTPTNVTILSQPQTSSYHGLGWHWGWKECLVHVVMLVAIGAISGVCSHFASSLSDDTVTQALGYVLVGLLVLVKVLGWLQSVYLFGVWRNPLFPCNVQSTDVYNRRKRHLNRIGYVRRFVTMIGEC